MREQFVEMPPEEVAAVGSVVEPKSNHRVFSRLEYERLNDLQSLCPKVSTALEIGARDGRLTALLLERCRRIIALDIELPRWKLPGVSAVRGDVRSLGFADNSFDLVLCTEVLEHLQPEGVEGACREILRVSRRYILVGVPYEQDLRLGRTTCGHCGQANPPYGHLSRFSERRLRGEFSPAVVLRLCSIGMNRERTNFVSTFLAGIAGNPWGTYGQAEPCLFCHHSLKKPNEIPLPKRLLGAAALRLNALQACLARPKPHWIHILFEKRR